MDNNLEEIVLCSEEQEFTTEELNKKAEEKVSNFEIPEIELQEVVEAKEMRRKFAQYNNEDNRTFSLYKGTGEKEDRLTEPQIFEKLTSVQDELKGLEQEALKRNDIYSTKEDLQKNKGALQNILEMQRVVQAYLTSTDISETSVGKGISEILDKDSEISSNKAISEALGEIVDYTYQSNKVSGSESVIDLNEDTTSFIPEFIALEESISSLETVVGRPDQNAIPNVKLALENILYNIPPMDPKQLDSLKKFNAVLKKNFIDLVKEYNTMSSKSSHPLSEKQISTLYKIAQRAVQENDTIELIIERIKGIKKLHDQSPNLQTNMNQLQAKQKSISEITEKSKQEAKSLKAELKKEFDSILTDLDQCEADLNELTK
ncbi:unnamed protein product [Moneuplotes crassus]|uniref:Uncharacterized protein n=1 Tax=Euplotes crassus TaxID=5936 RepID=A0AAD2CXW2_EUPCR|nr:unnamed protein product [Moneuplotes crassus]